MTGREVVEHAHLVAAPDEPADERRPDESGAAGDENPFFLSHETSRAEVSRPRPTAEIVAAPSRPELARARRDYRLEGRLGRVEGLLHGVLSPAATAR